MSLDLEYFHGSEAEQYSFYRIPKVLLTDRHYKGVSMEAKVLYGLMLDRMSLSVRNGWLDSGGRVYIYFTLEDALAALGCGKDKAVRLFKELDTPSGIGLIERRKQGQGKPTRIYVKNFTLPQDSGESAGPIPEVPPSQTSEKQKSGLRGGSAALTSENPKSALLESRSQDCGISDPNNTDKNKTEKGIINNAKTKILLNLEDEEARRVQSILHLSEAEVMEITHFERGSGLISTNNNNVTVEIKCSQMEKELITTDRRELQELLDKTAFQSTAPKE